MPIFLCRAYTFSKSGYHYLITRIFRRKGEVYEKQSKPKQKPESKPKQKPESEPKQKPESEPKPEPEPKAEPGSESKPEPESKSEQKSEEGLRQPALSFSARKVLLFAPIKNSF